MQKDMLLRSNHACSKSVELDPPRRSDTCGDMKYWLIYLREGTSGPLRRPASATQCGLSGKG